MKQVRTVFWSKLATGLLILYWVALVTSTHVPRLPVQIPGGGDKVAHFIAFAGLAFLVSWNWATRRPFLPAGFFFAFAVAACYGIVDELTQMLVPGRSCELADWLSDASGTLFGIILFCGFELAYRRLRTTRTPAGSGTGEQ